MAEGIEVRHARSCASRGGKRCNCEPGYRVAVYDAISKRTVSKTFKRRGELRALLWSDVDLASGLIRVERSMNSHGEIGEPKSRAGRRGVPIVATLRDLLVEHKLVMLETRASYSARARRLRSRPRPYASAR